MPDRLEERLLLDEEAGKPFPAVDARLLLRLSDEEGVDGCVDVALLPPSELRELLSREADGLVAIEAFVEVDAVLAFDVVRVLGVRLLGVLLGVVAMLLAIDSDESRRRSAVVVVSRCSGHSRWTTSVLLATVIELRCAANQLRGVESGERRLASQTRRTLRARRYSRKVPTLPRKVPEHVRPPLIPPPQPRQMILPHQPLPGNRKSPNHPINSNRHQLILPHQTDPQTNITLLPKPRHPLARPMIPNADGLILPNGDDVPRIDGYVPNPTVVPGEGLKVGAR